MDESTWCPRVFAARGCEDDREWQQIRRRADVTVRDELTSQLVELAAIRRPERTLDVSAAARVVRDLLDERGCGVTDGGQDAYGCWVYYPWSATLVRCLAPDDFHAVRTNRNQLKILPVEQHRLRQARMAIAGLSVGFAAAVTLVLEGIGGRFALADFDTLGLSNLNRLAASLPDLGVNKALLAARRLFELDPFLEIAVFSEGVTDGNLDAFLGATAHGPRLLIEECDDLYMKVRLRERARALGLPVLMDTSDGGMLDIERFDREPARPLLHGLVPNLSADRLRGLDVKDKVPIVLQILEADQLAPRTAASLVEVRQTLTSWPQLASSVALGAGLVTDAARRLLLGTLQASGRFRVDLERLVADPVTVVHEEIRTETAMIQTASTSTAQRPDREGSRVPGAVPLDDDMRFLIEHACLAPSGGNSQPWRFTVDGRRLIASVDPLRASTFLDHRGLAAYVALGAAAENVLIAATQRGLVLDYTVLDPVAPPVAGATTPRPVWQARIVGTGEPTVSEWFDYLPLRGTSRAHAPRDPLHVGALAALHRAATPGQLTWFDTEPQLEHLGTLHGRADRIRFLSETMHRELFAELRWSPEEAACTRDGLDVRTLALGPVDEAALRLLSHWPTLAVLKQIEGGRALLDLTRKAFVASSAVVVLRMPGDTPRDYVEGGRALQRLWLAATREGLSVHPQGTLVYLLKRLADAPDTFSEAEREELTAVAQAFHEVVPPDGGANIIVLRVGRAAATSVRSLRRPVESVVDVEVS